MQKSKNAFTMIELVFVIVVLGILAAVAVPRLAATRNDAVLAKGKSDLATIRSAIVTERQSRLITGDSSWIAKLSTACPGTLLFTGVDVNNTLLTYGIASGEWACTSDTAYTFTTGGITTNFTYSSANGRFTCTAGSGNCDDLTN